MFPSLACQIEVRQVEVRNRALENNDTQTLGRFHPDKKILEGLEDVPVHDVEGRIVEYDPPVRRRFLDDPYGCRIRFGHGPSSFKLRAGRCGDLPSFFRKHARQRLIVLGCIRRGLEDFTGLASLGDIVESPAVEVPLHRPGACTALPAVPACTAFAAVRMTSSTRSGWESIGTWLLSSS